MEIADIVEIGCQWTYSRASNWACPAQLCEIVSQSLCQVSFGPLNQIFKVFTGNQDSIFNCKQKNENVPSKSINLGNSII